MGRTYASGSNASLTGGYACTCRTRSCRTACIQPACISHSAVACCKRTVTISCCELATGYRMTHAAVCLTRTGCVAERAVRMVVVPVVAAMPVRMVRTAVPAMPPVRIISPIPGRCPACPEGVPEPVVDVRTVDIHRLYHVVRTVYVLITDHLGGDFTCRFIFLYIYRGNILEHILCQYSLDNNQVLVVSGCLYHAQIIHHSVTVQVKIGKSGVRVIEHGFELLNVLNRAEQCSHRLQIKRLAYVL